MVNLTLYHVLKYSWSFTLQILFFKLNLHYQFDCLHLINSSNLLVLCYYYLLNILLVTDNYYYSRYLYSVCYFDINFFSQSCCSVLDDREQLFILFLVESIFLILISIFLMTLFSNVKLDRYNCYCFLLCFRPYIFLLHFRYCYWGCLFDFFRTIFQFFILIF